MLAALDADTGAAGDKYELLRRKLISFFQWRGAPFPEDYADETLNVAARRISEGEKILNLPAYCRNIAGKILLAKHREREKHQAALKEQSSLPANDPVEDDARRFAFEQCLQQLPAESRELILTYYREEQAGKIESRERLAKGLGISLGALRIRACRIRSRLEVSVRETVEGLRNGRK